MRRVNFRIFVLLKTIMEATIGLRYTIKNTKKIVLSLISNQLILNCIENKENKISRSLNYFAVAHEIDN